MVNRAGNNSDGFKEEANGMPIRLSIGQVAAVIMFGTLQNFTKVFGQYRTV